MRRTRRTRSRRGTRTRSRRGTRVRRSLRRRRGGAPKAKAKTGRPSNIKRIVGVDMPPKFGKDGSACSGLPETDCAKHPGCMFDKAGRCRKRVMGQTKPKPPPKAKGKSKKGKSKSVEDDLFNMV